MRKHPRGVTAAYADIAATLRRFRFERVQGSVYVTEKDDMANLFAALLALKALPWFPQVVRHSRLQDRELERLHADHQRHIAILKRTQN